MWVIRKHANLRRLYTCGGVKEKDSCILAFFVGHKLNIEKAASMQPFLWSNAFVSENSAAGHRHSLGDRFSRFHHTSVGIVRRHNGRKLRVFEVRWLWSRQFQTARKQNRWRPRKERSQRAMCEEVS